LQKCCKRETHTQRLSTKLSFASLGHSAWCWVSHSQEGHKFHPLRTPQSPNLAPVHVYHCCSNHLLVVLRHMKPTCHLAISLLWLSPCAVVRIVPQRLCFGNSISNISEFGGVRM
jgi:hypothetical protein